MIWEELFNTEPIIQPTIQPAMKIATSRMANFSHWLPKNRNVTIGLAIAIPGLAIILTRAPVIDTIKRTWKRTTARISKKPNAPSKSSKGPTPKPDVSRQDSHTDDFLPKAPKNPFQSKKASVPRTPTFEAMEPEMPDSASISSEGSSEHKQKKLRMPKNIKRAWQNRPQFGHAHESPMSPE
ncbi:hypothetical protein Q7P37_008578 [Cladosporium fusiforme]